MGYLNQGRFENRREIEIIVIEGVQFIRQKDAYEQLRRWWCDLIDFSHDGRVYWVDVQLDEHRFATPYFVNGYGWCYQLVDLRDGETIEESQDVTT